MTWDYWICLYTRTHCAARGLRGSTIAAYGATLHQFRAYVEVRLENRGPDQVTTQDVLSYLEHLRRERDNGDSAVSRQATILKNFYRAIVALGHLEPRANPLAHFPRIKGRARKLPTVLSAEEIQRLLDQPPRNTILGLRDRALLTLLYGTGIRASECAGLHEQDVDLEDGTIRVTGKGGHQRVLPLSDCVVETLRVYRQARGAAKPSAPFFRSRWQGGLSRYAIYERVRRHAQQAGLHKTVSPHCLRHTFATHLVKVGTNLVTIRDLLGHRLITSTQIYLHVTAEDLRAAAAAHPIQRLAPRVEHLLPNVKLPFQPPPVRQRTG
jgi:integrase/recombinase XerD